MFKFILVLGLLVLVSCDYIGEEVIEKPSKDSCVELRTSLQSHNMSRWEVRAGLETYINLCTEPKFK